MDSMRARPFTMFAVNIRVSEMVFVANNMNAKQSSIGLQNN